jgi:hypothetical protein
MFVPSFRIDLVRQPTQMLSSTLSSILSLNFFTQCKANFPGAGVERLELAAVDNGGLDAGGDGAGAAASLLEGLDGLERLIVCDFAEDDVLSV